MTDAKLSIELAAGSRRWAKSSHERRIAIAILQDCLDRRGIKWEFQKCDDEVIGQILDAWATIIRTMSKPTGAPDR